VLHPQRFFYEPKDSAITRLHDQIHIVASKMTGMPVREFYFRRKEWLKLVRNPFFAMAIKELDSVLNALHNSESEADVEPMTINERKAELIDHQMDEALQHHCIRPELRCWKYACKSSQLTLIFLLR